LGVLTSSNRFVLKSKDLLVNNRSYFHFNWLFALPREAGVVAMNIGGTIGVFKLNGEGISKIKETPTLGPPVYEPERMWGIYFRDSADRVWVTDRRKSVAYDADLRPVATNAHRVLLEDSKGGIWSEAFDHSLHSTLYRMDPSGREASLDLGGLAAFCNGHSDDTIWLLNPRSLLRVGARSDKLEVLDDFMVSHPNQARIWHDHGRHVWVSSYPSDPNGWAGATCYVVN
jgi:hypothetical protein